MSAKSEELLQKETQYFAKVKPELLRGQRGKFALIKDEKLIGTFDTDRDAYEAGLKELGNVPFLVVQILETNPHPWIPVVQLGLLNASR